MEKENLDKQEANGIKPDVMRCSHSHNFEGGVQVTLEDISDWHKRILDDLVNDKDKLYSHTRSGNGIVFGKKNKETGEITIFEIRNGYTIYNYEKESENNA